jgi:hypothetical protein
LEAKGKMTQGRGGPTVFCYLSHFSGWLFPIGCPFPVAVWKPPFLSTSLFLSDVVYPHRIFEINQTQKNLKNLEKSRKIEIFFDTIINT